eukprot:gene26559-biopygen16858
MVVVVVGVVYVQERHPAGAFLNIQPPPPPPPPLPHNHHHL